MQGALAPGAYLDTVPMASGVAWKGHTANCTKLRVYRPNAGGGKISLSIK